MDTLHRSRSERTRYSQALGLLTRAAHALWRIKITDALFAAVAVLPPLLLVLGLPSFALLAFCPLLFAACLVAAYYDNVTGTSPLR